MAINSCKHTHMALTRDNHYDKLVDRRTNDNSTRQTGYRHSEKQTPTDIGQCKQFTITLWAAVVVFSEYKAGSIV